MLSKELEPLVRQLLEKYHPLSSAAWDDFLPMLKPITVSKGEKLLVAGEIVKGIWLLVSGITRSYFLKNNKEITTWIATEAAPFTNFRSLTLRVPSKETIEAIEDSYLLFVSAEDQQYMYDHHNEFNIIGRKMAEEYFVNYDDRLIAMLYATAEEKFKNLMQTQPEFFNRVPIKYLASYLDMMPETLSRLRKKPIASRLMP